MTPTNFRGVSISVVFIAIISFPLINSNLNFFSDIPNSENRQLAQNPTFDIARLDPYPSQFEKYYNDHFTLRSIMVKYYSEINMNIFKISPLPDQVVLGNDNWFFLAGNEINSYQGINRFNASELDSFKLELDYRKKYLNERGCKFYFLIAPIKANIYPEKIPSTFFRFNKEGWGEQLIDYLNKNSGVKPINVYPTLRDKKEKELVYLKLDNHWNQLGAFYAANEIFKRMAHDFPSLVPNSLNDFNIQKTETHGGNIIQMLSNVGSHTDTHFELIPKSGFKAKAVKPAGYPVIKNFPAAYYENDKEITGSKAPKILIITDSYGMALFPFISEKFGRSVKIFDAWQYKLNEEIVEKEKPDIVLTIVLESNLRNVLMYSSGLGRK